MFRDTINTHSKESHQAGTNVKCEAHTELYIGDDQSSHNDISKEVINYRHLV